MQTLGQGEPLPGQPAWRTAVWASIAYLDSAWMEPMRRSRHEQPQAVAVLDDDKVKPCTGLRALRNADITMTDVTSVQKLFLAVGAER